VRRIRLRCRVRIGAVLVRTPRQGQGRGDAGGHPAEQRMNRTIMQTDPTARHSPIGSFQRVCYLARAQCLPGEPRHPRRVARPSAATDASIAVGSDSVPWRAVNRGSFLDRAESNPSRMPFTDNDQGDTAGRSMQVRRHNGGRVCTPVDRLVGFMSPAAASPSSEREPPTDSTLHRCVRLTGRGMPPPLRH
jgi:hypothetical protein